MNERIIGTCSLCGGPVVVPDVFYSVLPPIPRCRDCGARMKRSYGRVILMEPSPWKRFKKNDFHKWEHTRKDLEDDLQWRDEEGWCI